MVGSEKKNHLNTFVGGFSAPASAPKTFTWLFRKTEAKSNHRVGPAPECVYDKPFYGITAT